MRFSRLPSLATVCALSLAASVASVATPSSAAAQEERIITRPDARRVIVIDRDSDRPIIGVTMAAESERGDTLGVRIEEVTDDSPAAKAGLKAGDRIQSVNGVSLRADRADAGDPDFAGVLTRRLQREVQKAKAGEPVELRVLSGTQVRTVRVTPVKESGLMGSLGDMGAWRAFSGDRPVLGLQVAATGSVRDTLGVFVQAVTKDGPAEKAGIIEGDRIAAINGVSLRVAREDAEDPVVGRARVERMHRELAKIEAGQSADLTVISGGRSRSVRVTPVKASALPGSDVERLVLPGRMIEPRRVRPPSGR